MAMKPSVRKFALTAHVVSSVGWLGAVIAFIGLSVLGMTSGDEPTVRGAYLVMDATGRYVLVPLSLASLLTGLVQSVGTQWGLLRHYWVIAKLTINVFASVVMLMYMQTLEYLSGIAASGSVDLDELRNPSPMLHASAALALLLGATVLSVYKPKGMTRYGQRRLRQERARAAPAGIAPTRASSSV